MNFSPLQRALAAGGVAIAGLVYVWPQGFDRLLVAVGITGRAAEWADLVALIALAAIMAAILLASSRVQRFRRKYSGFKEF